MTAHHGSDDTLTSVCRMNNYESRSERAASAHLQVSFAERTTNAMKSFFMERSQRS